MSRRLLIALAAGRGGRRRSRPARWCLLAHDFEPYGAAEKVAQVAIGGIWIVAGLIAWQRRPENRVGAADDGASGSVGLVPLLYWDAALPFTLAELVYRLSHRRSRCISSSRFRAAGSRRASSGGSWRSPTRPWFVRSLDLAAVLGSAYRGGARTARATCCWCTRTSGVVECDRASSATSC